MIRDALLGRFPLDSGEIVVGEADVDPPVLPCGVFGGVREPSQQGRGGIVKHQSITVECLDDFCFVLVQPGLARFYDDLILSLRYSLVAFLLGMIVRRKITSPVTSNGTR